MCNLRGFIHSKKACEYILRLNTASNYSKLWFLLDKNYYYSQYYHHILF